VEHGISDYGGPVLKAKDMQTLHALISLLNTHYAAYITYTINPSNNTEIGDIYAIPISNLLEKKTELLATVAETAMEFKKYLLSEDLTSLRFRNTLNLKHPSCSSWHQPDLQEYVGIILVTCQAFVEEIVFKHLNLEMVEFKNAGIGTPSGWHPLVDKYDIFPNSPVGLSPIPETIKDSIKDHGRVSLSVEQLIRIKDQLRASYIAGPGGRAEEEGEGEDIGDVDEGDDMAPAAMHISIPSETFLEELSHKMEIHPISIYWLLEQMRREEGLVCAPEMKRQTEDYFSVNLLRLLGHRWPMQDHYEKEEGRSFIGQKWVDEDGIIPLTPGAGEETLIERFHRFLDEEFTPERGPSVEIEAGQILGWKQGDEWGKQKAITLERWFERDFFRRHVSQFKKRPIAWHLTSKEGTFQVVVYYHKFDKNRLTILRARHVREVLESLRKQIGEAQSGEMDRQTLAKIADLERKILDIQDFDERLRQLLEGRDREARIWCPWKKPEEQPVGWDPDINDGVRVNIAPVQRLGLLAADVLATKDVKSLLAPEGRN
jgi:hypothetical protein